LYYFEPEKQLGLAKFYGIGEPFDLAIQVLQVFMIRKMGTGEFTLPEI
jgi:hypothetical protein